jgi:formyltetrahydrofolate-dependent phosphoribosylglycinamide formyltransferase
MRSDSGNRLRYAVLLSGTGRTLQNLLYAIERGELSGEIVAVVSSRSGVRGLDIARRAGIPAIAVERKQFESDHAFSDAIYEVLAPFDPHLLLLAGFLRKMHVAPAWEGRILNIHPALLPDMASASGKGFYGDKVHAAVLDAGATHSGATVHIVDNGYDTGPVIMTESVPVLPGDSVQDLAARVFAAECRLYPRAIDRYAADNAAWLHRTRLKSPTTSENRADA